jgi:PIN domain nuclease of toxin-antitoxin system
MTRYVWDASAVLAFLRAEPGAERLEAVLADSRDHFLGAVNLAEVASWLNERGMPADELNAFLTELDLHIRPFESALAAATGLLRAPTKPKGLSLGDRACLALAQSLDAVALTTDREWRGLQLDIRIECIRPAAS